MRDRLRIAAMKRTKIMMTLLKSLKRLKSLKARSFKSRNWSKKKRNFSHSIKHQYKRNPQAGQDYLKLRFVERSNEPNWRLIS